MVFKILDASAFYAGVPFRAADDWYTTSLVYDEIKHIKKNQSLLTTMIDTSRLRILEPQLEFVKKTIETSKITGDFQQLSKQDRSVLALALDLGGMIVTDDFAVSNVAKYLKIKVLPIMTLGIRDEGTWIHYCPACRQNFKNQKECPLCGTILKRKLLKR